MAIQVTLQILILFTFFVETVADNCLSSQDAVSPQECWNFRVPVCSSLIAFGIVFL